jgi:hypothetical protein
MFWELSSDRNYELIGATFEALNNDRLPSLESNPPIEVISPTNSTIISKLSTKRINSDYPIWETHKHYKFGDQVTYENKIYQCLVAHTSLPGWTPYAVGALWKPI